MNRPRSSLRVYVRTLERIFADRFDAPVVFSRRDWALAKEWHERGVPVGLVLEALNECGGKVVRSLSSVASIVEETWEVVQAGRRISHAGETGEESRTTAERVQAWKSVLSREDEESPLALLLGEIMKELELGLIDAAVADQRLDDDIMRAAPHEILEQARRAASDKLAPHRERMTGDVFDATLVRAVKERLRVSLNLPRLDF